MRAKHTTSAALAPACRCWPGMRPGWPNRARLVAIFQSIRRSANGVRRGTLPAGLVSKPANCLLAPPKKDRTGRVQTLNGVKLRQRRAREAGNGCEAAGRDGHRPINGAEAAAVLQSCACVMISLDIVRLRFAVVDPSAETQPSGLAIDKPPFLWHRRASLHATSNRSVVRCNGTVEEAALTCMLG
ncbi:hypothetical protein VTI74DRAFT_1194 [Chaetomium olivicolor]